MGCCGVSRPINPETYLRLAFERILLLQEPNRWMREGFEGAVISRALVAAGTLPEETARDVLEQYELAMALRQPQSAHMRMHRRAMAQRARRRVQLSLQRVAVCDHDFEHGSDRWTLERALFTNDATELDLSGTVPPSARNRSRLSLMRSASQSMPQNPNPQTIALRDDQGTTTTAHVGSSSWGGGSWQAKYTSAAPLSPEAQWIEIDGSRVELGMRTRASEVRIEDIEPMDPLRAVLYREILSPDRQQGGGDSVAIAAKALVMTGALGEDDTMLAELRAIADALTNAAPAAGLSEPWVSLLSRYTKDDGRSETLTVGAVIDDLEGFCIRVDTIVTQSGSFSICLAMSPGDSLIRHIPGGDAEPTPITWWARDDRGNAYVAFSDRGSGGPDVVEGQVTSLAPLDPEATELTLLPTGSHSRAVLTVPLAALGWKA
jgi:hypothetical protein